eukprot:gnl/TRDRNA2_/TRDRNA2_41323_c0_seq1.p1 gnl/TRDRNA2_/TRDRNA2_41323_c0~~gnl/TRDRNA2_/TRDRNA2_41323_c0_seq1.p1  ORF type:complete len:156 (+),score=35.97 gnl/TRDRNA2_/TRDRNA2_41323_c0_seq1:89-556(+)
MIQRGLRVQLLFAVVAASSVHDEEWLASKAAEDGVVTLASGLMYKVLEAGSPDGPSPRINTLCDVTYAGQLTDGKQFDAATFEVRPNQVIKGWTEAMQMMHEGDKWEVYIPSELAYGERGAEDENGSVPPNAALIFQIKINKVFGDHVEHPHIDI